MTAPGVLEAALYCDDLEAAEAFYGGVMGLERVVRKAGAHAFFRCAGTILLVFDPASTEAQSGGGFPVPPHGARGPGHVCFRASGQEIDRWRTRMAENGVEIEADFRWPNGARSIYFRDPAGNSLEFAEPRLWFDETASEADDGPAAS